MLKDYSGFYVLDACGSFFGCSFRLCGSLFGRGSARRFQRSLLLWLWKSSFSSWVQPLRQQSFLRRLFFAGALAGAFLAAAASSFAFSRRASFLFQRLFFGGFSRRCGALLCLFEGFRVRLDDDDALFQLMERFSYLRLFVWLAAFFVNNAFDSGVVYHRRCFRERSDSASSTLFSAMAALNFLTAVFI